MSKYGVISGPYCSALGLNTEGYQITLYLDTLQAVVDNIKKTGLNGYDYDFSVDYDAIAVDDIFDIHNYLRMNGIV